MPTVEQARVWYEETDPVHGFDHVVRVCRLACQLAEELGADMEIVQAAALLHDATDAGPVDAYRGSHAERSAGFAFQVLQEEGWPADRIEAVMDCIRSHRFRGEIQPKSLEAKILFDADKLDVVGAFGVARTIGYAVQAGAPIFTEPSQAFLRDGEKEAGEVHSAYHEYLYKLRRVGERIHTQPARRIAEQRGRLLKAFFEQLAAEARLDDVRVSSGGRWAVESDCVEDESKP